MLSHNIGIQIAQKSLELDELIARNYLEYIGLVQRNIHMCSVNVYTHNKYPKPLTNTV